MQGNARRGLAADAATGDERTHGSVGLHGIYHTCTRLSTGKISGINANTDDISGLKSALGGDVRLHGLMGFEYINAVW
jgi:hypothetical protein